MPNIDAGSFTSNETLLWSLSASSPSFFKSDDFTRVFDLRDHLEPLESLVQMDLRENTGLRALRGCRVHQDHVAKRSVSYIDYLRLQVLLVSYTTIEKLFILFIFNRN